MPNNILVFLVSYVVIGGPVSKKKATYVAKFTQVF
jgi:hypothetical protein